MRKSSCSLAIIAAALLSSVAMQAKPAWVKKAQDLGFKDIQNCQACHAAKPPALVDLGKWLVAEKTKRNAPIDLAWIKDYKKP
jgi:mono/diheme cytochrome c family protein